MSEHDDRYARSEMPRTTGEFRAAQDVSASTAEFKAFAESRDAEGGQRGSGGVWPEQPWAGDAPAAGSRRNMVIVAAVAAVLIVILVLIFAVG